MQVVNSLTRPIDLSEARLALLRFSAAAKTVQELEGIYRQAAADYDAAFRAYKAAAQRVYGVCQALGIQPRGGPGTKSL